MKPITSTQRQILEHAATETDGRIEWFPDTLKGGARQKVIDALIKNRLAIESEHGLQIDFNGYLAIGHDIPGYTGPKAGSQLASVTPTEPTTAPAAPDPEPTLKVAADEAVAPASDNCETPFADWTDAQIAAFEKAAEKYETTGAGILPGLAGDPDGAGLLPVEAAAPSAPLKPPREGSKHEAVVTMLQRPEGATVAQIQAETGWQAHTVRGFFHGTLKKRGMAVTSAKTDDGTRTYFLK